MEEVTCSADGCEKPVWVKSSGLCTTHYERWRRSRGPRTDGKFCSIDGCGGLLLAKGLCKLHYERNRLTGRCDLRTDQERFWEKVEKTDTCWNWLDTPNTEGYGRFSVNGVPQRAHRVLYEWMVGLIPEGLVLDHLCENTLCVNPAHLEPVTLAENFRRGREGR